MAPEVQRRLAAILSADVVGYSRLMAEDEDATVDTVTAYRERVAGLVLDHRGRVVDSPGDNILAEFPTATEAVRCAVEVQRVIGEQNTALPERRRMHLRRQNANHQVGRTRRDATGSVGRHFFHRQRAAQPLGGNVRLG